jgi:CRP-like cAMP-binding protein
MVFPSPEQNQLLAALPQDVQQRLFNHLRHVPLAIGDCLSGPGDPAAKVYFPIDSIVALLGATTNGDSTEVAVVGNEGIVGVAAFLGGSSTLGRAVAQSSGSAFSMRASDFLDEFNRHGELHRLALRYCHALLTQIAQTAVCNRHHSIDQQLCRWLLLCLDRLPCNELAMTQELIAGMLGVRREGVTEAAGKLQRLGLIEYSRGHIRVKSRRELEKLTCDCYRLVKIETDRLLS